MGLATHTARGSMMSFTARKSCIMRYSSRLGFLIGKMGVLHGEVVGANTPFPSNLFISGLIPFSLSCATGYCLMFGKAALALTCNRMGSIINRPTSVGSLDHSVSGMSAKASGSVVIICAAWRVWPGMTKLMPSLVNSMTARSLVKVSLPKMWNCWCGEYHGWSEIS